MTDRRPQHLRTALSPRMLLLLLVLVAAAAVCARLGVWQLERADDRAEHDAAVEARARAEEPAQPLADVLGPQESFPGALVGRRVEAEGTFEGTTLLVPGRVRQDEVGYLVLDAFRVDGTDGGVLPVVRGWVAEAEAPPPPRGPVVVTGHLQAGESAGRSDLPAGQVDAVSPGQLANLWEGRLYSGYLVASEPVGPGATGADPSSEVLLLPPPSLGGGGLNLQNLGYAVQWWVFGLFALLLWLRLVRDEARAAVEADDADGAHDADVDGPVGTAGH